MHRIVSIEVNGRITNVQDGIPIKKVLKMSGYRMSKYPEEGSLFTPCEVGGCWSCVVRVKC